MRIRREKYSKFSDRTAFETERAAAGISCHLWRAIPLPLGTSAVLPIYRRTWPASVPCRSRQAKLLANAYGVRLAIKIVNIIRETCYIFPIS